MAVHCIFTSELANLFSSSLATTEQNRIATPTIALFVFVFVTQFIGIMYSAYQIDPPATFEFLSIVGFLWAICWWLNTDSKRLGITWPLDLGMFLYVAWIVVLPYHLIKTRGVNGLVGIFAFIGVLLAAWLLSVIVVMLLLN